MKRTLLTIAALAVLAIPTAAVAKPGHGHGHGQAIKVANHACNAEKAEKGNREFRAIYGKRAMKSCRSVAIDEALSAVDSCRAELEALGTDAFTTQYDADGVGEAFGHCVSAKVRDGIDPNCTVDDPLGDDTGDTGDVTAARHDEGDEGDDVGDDAGDDEGDDVGDDAGDDDGDDEAGDDDGCETPQGDDDDGDHTDDGDDVDDHTEGDDPPAGDEV